MLKKIFIFLILLFSLFQFSQTQAGFLDNFSQPHISVVPYNEVLESIKNYALEWVSIYNDENLYRKWSNVIASIWIVVIFVMLLQVVIAIFKNSKENLKRDLSLLMLLLIISSLFTPFFSAIWSQMSWEERIYTFQNDTKKEDYTRIYLPANKAISIQPSYIDENWNTVKLEDTNIFNKRSEEFKENENFYSNDYLWIPAKVFQTQWVSKNTPTERYSKAFYTVNVDTLFKWMQWPIPNLLNNLGVSECTIQVWDIQWTTWNWAPLWFFESLNANWILSTYDWLKKDPTWKNIDNFVINGKELNWASIQVKVPKEKCNIWLFLLSNEYFSSYNLELKEDDNWWSIVWKMIFKDSLSLQYSDKISKIYSNLDYSQQKRLSYILKAISNLSFITWLDDEKLKSDENLKEIQLACWRIIMDRVQTNEDFKTCLKWDAYWDTTIYTQETTQKIWLSWKNKDINEWYVMPIAQSADWSFPLYYKIETSFAWIVSTAVKAAGWGIIMQKVNEVNAALQAPIFWLLDSTVWKIIWWVQWTIWAITPYQLLKEVRTATEQNSIINDLDFWSPLWQNPQLTSFQSYDLNWDWKFDYEQSDYSSDKFYAYHFSNDLTKETIIDLESRNVNYLNTPIYQSEKLDDSIAEQLLSFLDEGWEMVNWKYQLFKSLNSWQIYNLEESEIKNANVLSYNYNWKKYIAISDEKNKKIAENENQVKSSDFFFMTNWQYWKYYSLYDCIPDWNSCKTENLVKSKISVNDDYSKYYFLNEGLNLKYNIDEKWLSTKNVLDDYELNFKWYFIWTNSSPISIENWNNSLPSWEFFLKNNDSTYTFCSSKEDVALYLQNRWLWETNCKKTSNVSYDWKIISIEEYKIQKLSKWINVLNLYNITEKWEKVEEFDIYLAWYNKINNLKNYERLFLTNNFSSFQPSTNIYFYKKLKWGSLFSIDWSWYRNISQIIIKNWETLNWKDIDWKKFTQSWNTTLYECTKTECNWEKWITTDLDLEKVDFNKMWKSYSSQNARILLNPRLNLAITYTPTNQHYLNEYDKTKNICLINENKSSYYDQLFDNVPGKPLNYLENCSLIWDHNRITDIRLQTYIKTENIFNMSSENKSFTHIYIPLSVDWYISDFTDDRREQNYAWEASKNSSDLISFKKIEWIKITEWDVIVLKPWVVVWAYDYPFTIMVPTELLPFIKFVKLDNHSEEVAPSKVYTTWIYAWLSSSMNFLKDWAVSKYIIWWDAKKTTEAQQYTNYIFDKYDSRPDSLKEIEGIVPDRYFHSYYWSAYFTEAEAWANDSLSSWISVFFLNLVNEILKYRKMILETLYILGPFLVFFLLFWKLRKIFTWSVAIIIWLLVFPIFILFFVNLFSFN